MTKSTYCYNHHQGESISLPKVTLLHQGERETLPNVTLLPPGERGRLPDVTLLPPWERAGETIPNIIPNIILSPPGERESPQCYTVTTRVDGDSLMLHCYHQGREGDYTWCYTVTTRGEREIIPNVTPKVTPSPPEMRGRLHLTLHCNITLSVSLPEWFCSKMGYTWHHLHSILSKETAVDKVTRQSAECPQHWQWHSITHSTLHADFRIPDIHVSSIRSLLFIMR